MRYGFITPSTTRQDVLYMNSSRGIRKVHYLLSCITDYVEKIERRELQNYLANQALLVGFMCVTMNSLNIAFTLPLTLISRLD